MTDVIKEKKWAVLSSLKYSLVCFDMFRPACEDVVRFGLIPPARKKRQKVKGFLDQLLQIQFFFKYEEKLDIRLFINNTSS